MDAWFVVYCKPQKDKIAEFSIRKRGFEVYRPLLTRTVRNNKTQAKYLKEESLFPRYLFLQADPDNDSLTPAIYAPGVAGFLKFGGDYASVDTSVIENIKRCELMQKSKLQTGSEYSKGQLVYVNGEGFSDVQASFQEDCSDNRVIVLLNILGQLSSVKLPSSAVRKK